MDGVVVDSIRHFLAIQLVTVPVLLVLGLLARAHERAPEDMKWIVLLVGAPVFVVAAVLAVVAVTVYRFVTNDEPV